MIEKQQVLAILNEIKQDLIDDSMGIKSLKDINIYRKNLEVVTSPIIKKLVKQQKECINKYGEDNWQTIRLNRQISKELTKIYNN